MIYDLLKKYIKESRQNREENLDLNNLMFHQKYGLVMQLPHNWSYNLLKIIQDTTEKTLIIFPSTAKYRILYEEIGEALTYISWHEIYTGMQMTPSDVRYIQRAKAILADAELTFFLDPPLLPELIDQVRGYTNGCLVVLSIGNGNV